MNLDKANAVAKVSVFSVSAGAAAVSSAPAAAGRVWLRRWPGVVCSAAADDGRYGPGGGRPEEAQYADRLPPVVYGGREELGRPPPALCRRLGHRSPPPALDRDELCPAGLSRTGWRLVWIRCRCSSALKANSFLFDIYREMQRRLPRSDTGQ